MLTQRLEESIYDALEQTLGKHLRPKYVLSTNEVENSQNRQSGNIKGSWINPRFNFNNFITGSSNFLAYAAAKKVCEAPGSLYNPLYIYGEWGLGKTHLIQAIAKTLKVKGLNKSSANRKISKAIKHKIIFLGNINNEIKIPRASSITISGGSFLFSSNDVLFDEMIPIKKKNKIISNWIVAFSGA